MTHYTRWNFTMVTDRKLAPLATSYTRDSEIDRIRNSRDMWRWIAWAATAQSLLMLVVVMYYGLKG